MFAVLVFAPALVFATGLQAAPPAPAAPPAMLGYEEIVRCAGVSQAASELEGGESAVGGSLFDTALYWSLAAAQAAQASGRSAATSDRDQTLARIEAVRRLTLDDAEARALLQRCRQRTPDLG